MKVKTNKKNNKRTTKIYRYEIRNGIRKIIDTIPNKAQKKYSNVYTTNPPQYLVKFTNLQWNPSLDKY